MKRSRTSELGTLLATGRDIEYQELTLQFSKDRHVWELVERKDMEDMRREEIPPFLFRIVDFITACKSWQGTATQLLNEMDEAEVAATVVTKLLARFSGEVLHPRGIEYKTKRTGTSRLFLLSQHNSNDDDDGNRPIPQAPSQTSSIFSLCSSNTSPYFLPFTSLARSER